jgi:hypothetical protein
MSDNAFETGTGLDVLLGGGIQSGKSLILSGPPGAGKSLIALRFLSKGLMKDEPGIYVSFTRLPLSSTLMEARMHGSFADLLSSDEPLFLTSNDASGALQAVTGASRIVLDHPEAMRDPAWTDGMSDLLASCRVAGAGVMVLTYEFSPLIFLCDGVARLYRSEGRQTVELVKWPYGRIGVEAEREAGEWMR